MLKSIEIVTVTAFLIGLCIIACCNFIKHGRNKSNTKNDLKLSPRESQKDIASESTAVQLDESTRVTIPPLGQAMSLGDMTKAINVARKAGRRPGYSKGGKKEKK